MPTKCNMTELARKIREARRLRPRMKPAARSLFDYEMREALRHAKAGRCRQADDAIRFARGFVSPYAGPREQPRELLGTRRKRRKGRKKS